MAIPIADLAGRHVALQGEIERRVLEVLRAGRYVGGPVVTEVEGVAAKMFGRAGAVGVNSGTDAIMLALQAAGVRPGDEVVIPALSFFATAGAVCAIGAVPVIVDVLEGATLDPEAAARAVGPRTRAIMPVHLYGNRAAAPDVGVPIVDDAAQAVGADLPVVHGVTSAVSCYPTKTWGAAGDGGFVLADDPEVLDRVRWLGSHGMLKGIAHWHESVDGVVGRNTRLDAIQAAVLLAIAPHLPAWVAARRAHAAEYDAALPASVRPLPRDVGSPVHQYIVRVPDRDRVLAALQRDGVGAMAYYPWTLGQQPVLRDGRARLTDTPVADRLAPELLALPVHERLTAAEREQVMASLWRAVGA
jgi:dTDP-4-amino-4,6-dideoxygalactose transaminase